MQHELHGQPGEFQAYSPERAEAYAVMFPDVVLGFRSHAGHSTVLAQGAGRAPDREAFYDDNSRVGPDHLLDVADHVREWWTGRASWNMRWGTRSRLGRQREIHRRGAAEVSAAASDLPVTVLTEA